MKAPRSRAVLSRFDESLITTLMKRYVLGFLLERESRRVVLITKARPEAQKGKLNGVGGHIEEGEEPIDAMRREWTQETGTVVENWEELTCVGNEEFSLHVYCSAVDTFDQELV